MKPPLHLIAQLVAGMPTEAAIAIAGSEEVRVAGTSFRSEEMIKVLRGKDLWQGHAVLLPEPTNPHDPRAVQVWAEGKHVGFLPAEKAPMYHTALLNHLRDGVLVVVIARAFRAERGMGMRVLLSSPLRIRSP